MFSWIVENVFICKIPHFKLYNIAEKFVLCSYYFPFTSTFLFLGLKMRSPVLHGTKNKYRAILWSVMQKCASVLFKLRVFQLLV